MASFIGSSSNGGGGNNDDSTNGNNRNKRKADCFLESQDSSDEDDDDNAVLLAKKREQSRISSRKHRAREGSRLDGLLDMQVQLRQRNERVRENNSQIRAAIDALTTYRSASTTPTSQSRARVINLATASLSPDINVLNANPELPLPDSSTSDRPTNAADTARVGIQMPGTCTGLSVPSMPVSNLARPSSIQLQETGTSSRMLNSVPSAAAAAVASTGLTTFQERVMALAALANNRRSESASSSLLFQRAVSSLNPPQVRASVPSAAAALSSSRLQRAPPYQPPYVSRPISLLLQRPFVAGLPNAAFSTNFDIPTEIALRHALMQERATGGLNRDFARSLHDSVGASRGRFQHQLLASQSQYQPPPTTTAAVASATAISSINMQYNNTEDRMRLLRQFVNTPSPAPATLPLAYGQLHLSVPSVTSSESDNSTLWTTVTSPPTNASLLGITSPANRNEDSSNNSSSSGSG